MTIAKVFYIAQRALMNAGVRDRVKLIFKDHTGKTYMNVDKYFQDSLVD